MQNGTDLPGYALDRLSGAKAQFPPGTAFIDGQFVPISEAKISILDWGFLRSDATYDVVHVWKRRFFQLDKHLDRFLASVAKLRMTVPVDRATLTEILRQCVRRSELADAYVEMICTRGNSPTFSRDPRDAANRLICFAIPFGWIANEAQRQRGLSIAISSVVRIPPSSVDPTVKNYHWLDLVKALYEGYDRGAENVVLVNELGEITEGPGFNIFAVSGGPSSPRHLACSWASRASLFSIFAPSLASPRAPRCWPPSTLPGPTRFLSPRPQAASCRLRASMVAPSGAGRSAR